MAVVPSTVNSMFELAEQALEVAADALATTDAGAPTLQYVSPALPAFDCCPSLIVASPALGAEAMSPLLAPLDQAQNARFGRVNQVSLIVYALRCAPSMDAKGSVSTEEITAAAQEVLQDGWALWCGFFHAIKSGEFGDLCSWVTFDGGRALTEQGECVGWSLVLRAVLNGIPDSG